jgi:Domain of unknown function (DUF4337)
VKNDKTEENKDGFKTLAAIVVSVFAMILAISNIGSSNASGEATENQIAASNTYAFYQAKTIRQTDYKLFNELLKIQMIEFPNLNLNSHGLVEKDMQAYAATIQRYESEPETGEGKKELLEKAKKYEKARDNALRKDPWFDYSEGLLQVAIVLASVSIVTSAPLLFFLSTALGLIGCLSCLNGFFMFI